MVVKIDRVSLARELRRICKMNVSIPRDDGETLAAQRSALMAIANLLDPPIGVESMTAEEKLTGPENSREEVVGTSTKGKSSNLGDTGFSGGCIEGDVPHGKFIPTMWRKDGRQIDQNEWREVWANWERDLEH